jgi:hypothetical protein
MAISNYWLEQGKTEADKQPGKTWLADNGTLRCNECCNKDYDDDEECTHAYYRPKCPYCLGTGTNATTAADLIKAFKETGHISDLASLEMYLLLSKQFEAFFRETMIEQALKIKFPNIQNLTVAIEDGILSLNFTRDETHTDTSVFAGYAEIMSAIKSV